MRYLVEIYVNLIATNVTYLFYILLEHYHNTLEIQTGRINITRPGNLKNVGKNY